MKDVRAMRFDPMKEKTRVFPRGAFAQPQKRKKSVPRSHRKIVDRLSRPIYAATCHFGTRVCRTGAPPKRKSDVTRARPCRKKKTRAHIGAIVVLHPQRASEGALSRKGESE